MKIEDFILRKDKCSPVRTLSKGELIRELVKGIPSEEVDNIKITYFIPPEEKASRWQFQYNGEWYSGPTVKNVKILKETAAEFAVLFYDGEGRRQTRPIYLLRPQGQHKDIQSTDEDNVNGLMIQVLLFNINEQKEKLYGNKYPIEQRQLLYYLFSNNKKAFYHTFEIPKKNGKLRSITAPCEGLKAIQRCLNSLLQNIDVYKPNDAASGFVRGKSTVNNAIVHVHQNYVYNIDLKDFFPSITSGRVYTCLRTMALSDTKGAYEAQVSAFCSMVTDLCCYEGHLAQGAPTSPTISNIICKRLDWRLSKLAERFGLKYSRYADDISFSGMNNVFHQDGDFIKELQRYIEKEGFVINEEKTRLCRKSDRQEVTGLIVNKKVNTPKRYVKQIRMLLHLWEQKGYDEAQRIFLEHYLEKNPKNRYQISSKNRNIFCAHYIENIIEGKLAYLKMIRGEDNTYKNLYQRFLYLYRSKSIIETVLSVWRTKGMETAKNLYYWYKDQRENMELQESVVNEVKFVIGRGVKHRYLYDLLVSEFERLLDVKVSYNYQNSKWTAYIDGKQTFNGWPIYCKTKGFCNEENAIKRIKLIQNKQGKIYWLCVSYKLVIIDGVELKVYG